MTTCKAGGTWRDLKAIVMMASPAGDGAQNANVSYLCRLAMTTSSLLLTTLINVLQEINTILAQAAHTVWRHPGHRQLKINGGAAQSVRLWCMGAETLAHAP
jgi:hypothetical protein